VTGSLLFEAVDYKAKFLVVEAAVMSATAGKTSQGTPRTPDPLVMSSADGTAQNESAFQTS